MLVIFGEIVIEFAAAGKDSGRDNAWERKMKYNIAMRGKHTLCALKIHAGLEWQYKKLMSFCTT
jgi:hypothetical protein